MLLLIMLREDCYNQVNASLQKRVDFLQQLLDLRVRPGQHVHDVTEEPFGKKPTKCMSLLVRYFTVTYFIVTVT